VPGGNGELPAVFWRLAAVMVPNRLGMFVAPFLTYYLAAGLHLGAGRVAIVMTAFGAGWAAGPPVAGHLADRLGRRGVIVATQVAAAAAYYGLGQARTLPQLAGGAVAVGLLFDGWRAPATAMVYDACAGQAQQARAMTRLFWMQNVGLIGSSVGAGVLAVTAGWQWLFAGNAIASVVFAAASWLAPQPELADAAEPAWHHAAAALSCAHPVASADATAPRGPACRPPRGCRQGQARPPQQLRRARTTQAGSRPPAEQCAPANPAVAAAARASDHLVTAPVRSAAAGARWRHSTAAIL
jgi:MFS family permease